MKSSKMEPEIKKKLSDLSKMPQKEFERQFNEWMARDEVARSLQAKLRMDLIRNFNQTRLGKQILSQTTTTTSAYGAPAQRLTLSPLTLALNTLVAEFLYAQNCHFSLSVFCTEIPFRNTLPDFESVRYFRFTESEIIEILAAISADIKFEKEFKDVICRDYAANPTVSLLLLLLKSLLVVNQVSVNAKEKTNLQSEQESLRLSNESHTTVRRDVKVQTDKRNFHHLNKYLIILSKKVQEMATQFEKLQQYSGSKSAFPTPQQSSSRSPPRPLQQHHRQEQRGKQQQQPKQQKQLLSPLQKVSIKRKMENLNGHKCENINRSLERITHNLKQMAKKKRNSVHIIPIVKAIDAMSKQFERCASKFEQVSKNLINLETQRMNLTNQAQPIATQTTEKSYIDWIHEMRTTSNGERFLIKIEAALSKTLKKQKQELQREAELKLMHQKELLRVKYKQKLLEKLTKFSTRDTLDSVEGRNEDYYKSVEKKLQEFESRHYDLLSKIEQAAKDEATNVLRKRDNKIGVLGTEQTEENTANLKQNQIQISQREFRVETSTLPLTKTRTPNEDRPDKEEVVDPNVDHVICEAKMRIRELEFESNQLEQSFRHYLERQRLQKEASKRAAEAIWNKYSVEKCKIENQFQLVKQHMKKYTRERRRRRSLENTHDTSVDSEEKCSDRWLRGLNVDRSTKTVRKRDGASNPGAPLTKDKASRDSSVSSSSSIVFTNAIYEAQSKLFHNQSKLRTISKTSPTPLKPQMEEMDVNSLKNIPQIKGSVDGNITLPTTVVDINPESDLKEVFNELQLQEYMNLPKDVAESTISTSSNLVDSLEKRSPKKYYKGDTDSSSDTLSKSIGAYELKVKRTLEFVNFDISANKPNGRNEQQQKPPQQLKERVKAKQENLHSSTAEPKTFALFQLRKDEEGTNERKSELAPTSLVLQQSMAKMNKLFEKKISEEEKRLEKEKPPERVTPTKAIPAQKTTKYRNKRKLATATMPTTKTMPTIEATKVPSIGGNQSDGYNDVLDVDIVAVSSVAEALSDKESLKLSYDGDSGGCGDGCVSECDRTELANKNMKIIAKNKLTKTAIKTEEMVGVVTDVEASEKIATMSGIDLRTEMAGVMLEKQGTMREEDQMLPGTKRQSKEILIQNNSYCPSEVFNLAKIVDGRNKQDPRKQQKQQAKDQLPKEQQKRQNLQNEQEQDQQQKQNLYHELKSVHVNVASTKFSESEQQQQRELGEIIGDINVAAVADVADDDKKACVGKIVTTQSECSDSTMTSIELEQKVESQSSSEFWE